MSALVPATAEGVRHAEAPTIAFSADMAAADGAIKSFLFARMYRHPRIARIMSDAEGVVEDLFAWYTAEPSAMPAEWAEGLAGAGEADRARRAANFIAGMTDRYALIEHARRFDSTPELR
jgi:dGTPase